MASYEPWKAAFDDPALRQDEKARVLIGSFYDLDGPFPDLRQGIAQLLTCIAAAVGQMVEARDSDPMWVAIRGA